MTANKKPSIVFILNGQPRLRRVGGLRWRHPPRRAHAAHRPARSRRHAPTQLQCRGAVHALALGAYDGPFLDSLRYVRSADRLRSRRLDAAYVSSSMVHMPTLPHPECAGKTGNGDWADCLAEMDYRTGQLLDAIKEAGIEDDTLVIVTSDNGPEATDPWQGDRGPWRGTYFTAMEASLRAPFIIRWPGKVRTGSVNNEIVHIVDLYTTRARVPSNRADSATPRRPAPDGRFPHRRAAAGTQRPGPPRPPRDRGRGP